ncbi:MAG: hypothetical protein B7C24_15960 [Bacteroidetes bacterium 4572_77]|nr:MAG: hypothetical protein B7C24_15960 [Bacteroidetes bacterium 4572_77]
MILLSTAYFPPISYIALLFQHQEGQIDLWETYSKQTYRNRCYIASASGLMALSVPVKKPFGNKSITKDITIDYTENWQQTHWRSIKSAYQSSPFFLYYQDEIEAVFKEKHGSLHQMNAKILGVLLDLIGFDVPLKITEGFIKPAQESNDFRFSRSEWFYPRFIYS